MNNVWYVMTGREPEGFFSIWYGFSFVVPFDLVCATLLRYMRYLPDCYKDGLLSHLCALKTRNHCFQTVYVLCVLLAIALRSES